MMKPSASKQHRGRRPDRQQQRRSRGGKPEHRPAITLTHEGVPAVVPDAPPPSRTVFVSDQSRATYPWLPGRVIAGSVWRGPRNERVQVDDAGNALPWRARAAPVR